VTLNLKHPDGRRVFERLVVTADVLVENLRPGVMARLGLGYDHLAALQPRLVYCAISGFGQDGPLSSNPAYDQIIQGLAGVMDVTGDEESGPLRVGFPICDTIGGLAAAFAVAAALRQSQQTGRGGFIDVSMLEATLASMGWVVSNYLIAGEAPRRSRNDNFTASPSGAFRTRDGILNIAANKQEQFEALCRELGRPQLIDDPRFADREARLRHRQALAAVLEESLAARPAAEWEERLNKAGVPAGRVLSVPEALAHLQISARRLVQHFEGAPGVGRDIAVTTTGFTLSGHRPAAETPPPRLGEHTDDVLQALGLTAEEIADLRRKRAI
jgi:formyl-CoA transferase